MHAGTFISVAVLVGTVMALLVAVIILIITVIILLIILKRRTQELSSNHNYDYAMERAPRTETNEQLHTNSMEMKANEAYENPGQVGISNKANNVATHSEVYEEIH